CPADRRRVPRCVRARRRARARLQLEWPAAWRSIVPARRKYGKWLMARSDGPAVHPERVDLHAFLRRFSILRASVHRLAVRLQHHLDAAILTISEHLVGFGRGVERQAVGDDERRIDLAAFDALQERTHVPHHVRLPHPQRESLLERRAERDLVEESAVNAGYRDDAALAPGLNPPA